MPVFRGIRLDVWGMDEEGTVYNSEMQALNTKNLPRRSRYYQSVLDAGLLEGEECFAALTEKLIHDSRNEDLLKAAGDKEYRDQLYKEYGIE